MNAAEKFKQEYMKEHDIVTPKLYTEDEVIEIVAWAFNEGARDVLDSLRKKLEGDRNGTT